MGHEPIEGGERKMASESESPKPGRLARISPKQIQRNPQNPRLLFDPDPMEILRKSISKVGILVPLLVYERSSDDQYVILDGERRWKCALELNLPNVPVNIIPEPTTIQNI